MVINELIKNEIFDRVDLSFIPKVCKNKVINGNLFFYFSLCSSKWLPLTNIVSIDDVEYTVNESDDSNYEYMISGRHFNCKKSIFKFKQFHFFVGTPIDVTKQYSTKSNVVSKKTPFVWVSLMQPPTETVRDVTKSFRYEYQNVKIFFMASTLYDRKDDDWRLSEVLKFVEPYVSEFVKAIRFNGKFNHIFDYTMKFYTKASRDDEVNFLDGTQLSAIELSATLKTEEKCIC